jgi:peptide deformylase
VSEAVAKALEGTFTVETLEATARVARGVERPWPGGYIGGMDVETLDTLRLRIVPDPVLRARARLVRDDEAERVRDLVSRMYATMYNAPGIGLAAPQVGVGWRVAIIDLKPEDRPAPLTLVNPEIVGLSDELATHEEGCLSLPGQYAEITRPARVKVRYHDHAGAMREIEAEGLLAACLQHEIDHLDGILFVDHLSPLKRNMIIRRVAKEQRLKQARA